MNATQRTRSRFSAPTEASGSENVPSHVEFDSDQMIDVSNDDIQSDIDPNRPYNRDDESGDDISGALQSSLDAVCSLPSVSWARRIIQFENGHADRVLLIVSCNFRLKIGFDT